MSTNDVVTIGLSDKADAKLTEIGEMDIFNEKIDAYRFAISLALAHGVIPPEVVNRKTVYNVGSLDPHQHLQHAVEALMPEQLEVVPTYRLIERLAEWGVNELYSQAKSGVIDFPRLLGEVETKAA